MNATIPSPPSALELQVIPMTPTVAYGLWLVGAPGVTLEVLAQVVVTQPRTLPRAGAFRVPARSLHGGDDHV